MRRDDECGFHERAAIVGHDCLDLYHLNIGTLFELRFAYEVVACEAKAVI